MSDFIVPTESPKDFYVYVHRRATDGRIFYYGKGHGKRAWSKLGRNSYWVKIVNKHGLKVEIVADGLLEWYAFELERDLIALHGRDGLANSTDGGEGPKGRVSSKETIERMKAAQSDPAVKAKIKLTRSTPEAKEKHRKAISLAKKGKPLSEKARLALADPKNREKRGIAIKEAYAKLEGKEKRRAAHGAKPIMCIETGEIFQTSCCAEKWLRQTKPKASGPNLLNACRGIYKQAYGYTWRYV